MALSRNFSLLGLVLSLCACSDHANIGSDNPTDAATGGGTGGSVTSGGSGGLGGHSASGGASSGGQGAGGSCSTGYDAGSTGTTCTTDAECQTNEACGFKLADACSATGQCFPRGIECNCFSPACGCDGKTMNAACAGLPDGYAPAPVAHHGACATDDGGTGTFACAQTGSTCTAADQYCYGGSETVFYLGDGGIVVGCNALPSECKSNPTCDCVMKYYEAGFCVCNPSDGGITVQCSTV